MHHHPSTAAALDNLSVTSTITWMSSWRPSGPWMTRTQRLRATTRKKILPTLPVGIASMAHSGEYVFVPVLHQRLQSGVILGMTSGALASCRFGRCRSGHTCPWKTLRFSCTPLFQVNQRRNWSTLIWKSCTLPLALNTLSLFSRKVLRQNWSTRRESSCQSLRL